MSDLIDVIGNANISDLLVVFFDSGYYEFFFPFLLSFALFYAILCHVKIFQHKKGSMQGKPVKSVIIVISFVVSYYAVSFEISEGNTLGSLLMMLFPNISALTIGILSLYIVGAIFAKNFFSGLFDKSNSAILYLLVGGIGLGSVVYYTGIAMGFWDNYPITNIGLWNTIFAVLFLVLGIVFLLIGMVPFAIIFLYVLIAFMLNYSVTESILKLFIDPVVFILTIVGLSLSWMNSNDLEYHEKKYKKMLEKYERDFGGKNIQPYDNRIHDILESSMKNKKKYIDKLKNKE
jgi:hypothetical protein